MSKVFQKVRSFFNSFKIKYEDAEEKVMDQLKKCLDTDWERRQVLTLQLDWIKYVKNCEHGPKPRLGTFSMLYDDGFYTNTELNLPEKLNIDNKFHREFSDNVIKYFVMNHVGKESVPGIKSELRYPKRYILMCLNDLDQFYKGRLEQYGRDLELINLSRSAGVYLAVLNEYN